MHEARPRLDTLHVCLIVAGGVLLLTMWSGHGYLVRRSSEEWLVGTSRSVAEFRKSDPIRAELTELEHDPAADAGRLRDLQAQAEEAQRIFSRDTMRAADRQRELSRLIGVHWYGLAASFLALALATFGWFRWMKAWRSKPSA